MLRDEIKIIGVYVVLHYSYCLFRKLDIYTLDKHVQVLYQYIVTYNAEAHIDITKLA